MYAAEASPREAILHLPSQTGNLPALADDRSVRWENTPPIGGRVTLLHKGALVVFEGASRVVWHRETSSEWTPIGLWPRPHEAAFLTAHLARREPMLVVLRDPIATLPLLTEELDRSDPLFTALAGHSEGDVVELQIPALDWLPAEDRLRGLRFLAWSASVLSATPHPLCPPYLVDEPAGAPITSASYAPGEVRASRTRYAERSSSISSRRTDFQRYKRKEEDPRDSDTGGRGPRCLHRRRARPACCGRRSRRAARRPECAGGRCHRTRPSRRGRMGPCLGRPAARAGPDGRPTASLLRPGGARTGSLKAKVRPNERIPTLNGPLLPESRASNNEPMAPAPFKGSSNSAPTSVAASEPTSPRSDSLTAKRSRCRVSRTQSRRGGRVMHRPR